MEQKIKFAIIGFGHIGKRHAEVILNNLQCELVAICDSSPKEHFDLSKYPNVGFYPSLDALIEQGVNLDVICIASPNGLHEEHALKSLEAGYHIVLEKPMALTKVGCERIIFKALQRHKQVFCVMQNRYSPPSVWLKSLLEGGYLGKIFMVQINCYWNRDDRYYKVGSWHGKKDLDGGTLFTQFSHFVDLMYWCFGDITNIKSKFKNFTHQHNTEFEDSGFITFDFVEGGIGSFNYSTAVWDKNMESSITVLAEKGSIKVSGQYMDKVEHCHIKDYEMINTTTNTGNKNNHQYIYENLVDVLQGKGMISTNALEGMKVVEIIERMYSE